MRCFLAFVRRATLSPGDRIAPPAASASGRSGRHGQASPAAPISPAAITTALLLACAFLLGACGPSAGAATPSAIMVQPQGKRSPAASLEDLLRFYGIAVVGRVLGEDGVINTARLPGDRTRPDPHQFGWGQVYVVEVARPLKGATEPVLRYVQREGGIEDPRTPHTPENKQAARAAAGIPPARFGVSYLFLLNRREYDRLYYGGPRFVLPEAGDVEPEGNWPSESRAKIPPRPTAQFLADVERIIRAQAAAPPTPGGKGALPAAAS